MLAIKGGTIYTITRGIIRDGVVLVDDGKILEVGHNVSIPDDCKIIDACENVVFPGMIDAHTHIGVIQEGVGEMGADHNEKTDPITPQIRVIDAIDPFDPAFPEVMRAGITTVFITPGSANPIGGQGSIVKTCGKTVEEMLMVKDAGMKFALGENPKRVYGSRNKAPSTRMGTAALIREYLTKANEYLQKKEAARLKEERMDTDFRLESLINVVTGKTGARFHAHKACDIMTAIRIADEFDLDLILDHCTEGDKIIHELIRRNIPVVLSPLMNARTKPETKDRNFEIAGTLANNGIQVAISTDGISQSARWLPLNAGLCVRYGMKEDDALKSITITAAKILRIDDRLGSLEKNKDADIIIMDGHPLETRTKIGVVIIKGKVKYLRAENLHGEDETE